MVIVLCSLVGAPVSADDMGIWKHKGGDKFISLYDSNGDQLVTLEEFNAESPRRFDDMDANRNGMVTPEEFSSYLESRKSASREARFQDLDSNQDGTISEAEYIESQRQQDRARFGEMDANGDKQLSLSELDWHDDRGPGRSKHGKNDKDCAKRAEYDGGKVKGKPDGKHGDHFFSQIDTDKNGLVSRQESEQMWQGWFKRLDANNDQVITLQEVTAIRGKMHL